MEKSLASEMREMSTHFEEQKGINSVEKPETATIEVPKNAVKLSFKTTDGRVQTVIASFKRLRVHVIMPEIFRNSAIIETLALVNHANGVLTDKEREASDFLKKISSDDAKSIIEHFVKTGYSGIEVESIV